jgi:hypothetical protein
MLLSALLTVSVMLPILGLSYAALHALLADRIESDLRTTVTTTRLAFEARISAAVDKITSASRQAIFSNALADSAERNITPFRSCTIYAQPSPASVRWRSRIFVVAQWKRGVATHAHGQLNRPSGCSRPSTMAGGSSRYSVRSLGCT